MPPAELAARVRYLRHLLPDHAGELGTLLTMVPSQAVHLPKELAQRLASAPAALEAALQLRPPAEWLRLNKAVGALSSTTGRRVQQAAEAWREK